MQQLRTAGTKDEADAALERPLGVLRAMDLLDYYRKTFGSCPVYLSDRLGDAVYKESYNFFCLGNAQEIWRSSGGKMVDVL